MVILLPTVCLPVVVNTTCFRLRVNPLCRLLREVSLLSRRLWSLRLTPLSRLVAIGHRCRLSIRRKASGVLRSRSV